ncbi:hypothetical protein Taro_033762 [Colocasia esculenta]|uniref:indole-3-pyruvate monooxygenase n=1 Tax=Colocasia esculenta TaxID=4460 RepID=A0A843W7X3_COLES|nr:hypothetical protein [Colocasia esculenta]
MPTERSAEGPKCTWVQGPIIVGAGPSGLAVAACLADLGVPSTVLEKAHCVASLWQHRTYDRLKLHLPKQFCELPLMGFPPGFPKYPSKQQFVAYAVSYAARFGIRPLFGCAVRLAEFDFGGGCWRVMTESGEVFLARWLVVATGENAQPVIPELPGVERFAGRVIHTSSYKSGRDFRGEKVLVVGCGNSGMEISLDLCRHNARPHMVVRNSVSFKELYPCTYDVMQVHVLPREILGLSTFGIAMALVRWFPLRAVDRLLLVAAHLILGDTDRLGLRRPKTGPIELKNSTGKTPVLDVGALAHIKAGKIKVSTHRWLALPSLSFPLPSSWSASQGGRDSPRERPRLYGRIMPVSSGRFEILGRRGGLLASAALHELSVAFAAAAAALTWCPLVTRAVKEVIRTGARFVDGREDDFDSIILATGYKSNVPSWLKGGGGLFTNEGLPNRPFPGGWKGEKGLYSVGFTMRGLLGTSSDAVNIARDIYEQWNGGAPSSKGDDVQDRSSPALPAPSSAPRTSVIRSSNRPT